MGGVWMMMKRTLQLVGMVGAVSTLFGLLVGTWLSLCSGSGKLFALMLLALMLLCPPFLWAVGVQGWKGFVPFQAQLWFDGFSGHVLASSLFACPLAALICVGGLSWISQSAVSSVLLIGGRAKLWWLLLKAGLPLALGAGLLSALLVAGEAGTGQMMGWQSAAGVIHAAFAIEHDFQKAAERAWMLVFLLLPLAALASWLIARHKDGRRLAVQAGAVTDRSVGLILPVVAALPLLIGLAGLLRPLTNGPITPVFRDALITLSESGEATLELGVLLVLMVTSISLLLGKLIVTRPKLWCAVLIAGLVLIGLPPSIHGLGWILLKNRLHLDLTAMPRALEPALLLSLRWTLLASHFAALAWQSVPTSAMDAMRLMGLPRLRRWWLLAWPVLFTRVLPIAVIIALLCLGDATAIVIVQPPGWATYATRLFSTMDNAPEKQVAAMCLTYLTLPLVLGALGLVMFKLARLVGASQKS